MNRPHLLRKGRINFTLSPSTDNGTGPHSEHQWETHAVGVELHDARPHLCVSPIEQLDSKGWAVLERPSSHIDEVGCGDETALRRYYRECAE